MAICWLLRRFVPSNITPNEPSPIFLPTLKWTPTTLDVEAEPDIAGERDDRQLELVVRYALGEQQDMNGLGYWWS